MVQQSPSGPWHELDRPPLRQEALRRALLPPSGAFSVVDVLPSAPSTNRELAARAAAGGVPDLAALTTDHQTAGRGRLGRDWTTPARAALTTSVLLRPTSPPETWAWLPLMVGLAVTEVLRTVAGVDARLKWPNDVLVEGAGAGKVCGVLSEVVRTPEGEAVVVGFGLNVLQTPDELPVATATSLRLSGAAVTDRDTLLRACLRRIAERYEAWSAAGGDAEASGLAAAVREACGTLGMQVRVELPGSRAPLEGVAEGIDGEGRLLVRQVGSVVGVAAGDVVHLRPAERPS